MKSFEKKSNWQVFGIRYDKRIEDETVFGNYEALRQTIESLRNKHLGDPEPKKFVWMVWERVSMKEWEPVGLIHWNLETKMYEGQVSDGHKDAMPLFAKMCKEWNLSF